MDGSADTGFEVLQWEDSSALSLEGMLETRERIREGSLSPLGPRFVMGEDAPRKIAKVVKSLEERRITVYQGLLAKK